MAMVTEQKEESFLEGYRKIQPTAQLFYSLDVGVLPKDRMPIQITKRSDNCLNTLENNVSEQDVISGFNLSFENMQLKTKWHESDFLECINNNIQLKISH